MILLYHNAIGRTPPPPPPSAIHINFIKARIAIKYICQLQLSPGVEKSDNWKANPHRKKSAREWRKIIGIASGLLFAGRWRTRNGRVMDPEAEAYP
ncbi:UNVERIFIED_CONTAM: hypothetical protein PYX00_010132 [Menopon gallinae]|uniref:Uncharacterized protein n=1 Tax=Menopon gallinae TaxID=328185 RepID=A0AAW2HDU8_9NEOP